MQDIIAPLSPRNGVLVGIAERRADDLVNSSYRGPRPRGPALKIVALWNGHPGLSYSSLQANNDNAADGISMQHTLWQRQVQPAFYQERLNYALLLDVTADTARRRKSILDTDLRLVVSQHEPRTKVGSRAFQRLQRKGIYYILTYKLVLCSALVYYYAHNALVAIAFCLYGFRSTVQVCTHSCYLCRLSRRCSECGKARGAL